MSFEASVKIPLDRVGVLVGKRGKVKKQIEDSFGVDVAVDSKSGEVSIRAKAPLGDLNYMRALDVINAIARGFSPNRAMLLEDEELMFSIIDLKGYAGKSKNDVRRIKGRIIGLDGKCRRIIEELTDCAISVYGDTVSIIGLPQQVRLATDSIDMLASGSNHKSVYNMLQKARTKAKMDRMLLWEEM